MSNAESRMIRSTVLLAFALVGATACVSHAQEVQSGTVPSGGIVSIVQGSYTAASGHAFTIGADGTAVTLEAPVGTVIIGN